jgi:hypothetical protein
VLEVEVERPVRVVLQRVAVADGEAVEGVRGLESFGVGPKPGL